MFIQLAEDIELINTNQIIDIISDGRVYLKSGKIINLDDFTPEKFLGLFKKLNGIDVEGKIEELIKYTKKFIYFIGYDDSKNVIANVDYIEKVIPKEYGAQIKLESDFVVGTGYPYSQVVRYLQGNFEEFHPEIPMRYSTKIVEVRLPITETYRLFDIGDCSDELKNAFSTHDMTNSVITFKCESAKEHALRYSELDSKCNHVWSVVECLSWCKMGTYKHQIEFRNIVVKYEVKGHTLKDGAIEVTKDCFTIKYCKAS